MDSKNKIIETNKSLDMLIDLKNDKLTHQDLG